MTLLAQAATNADAAISWNVVLTISVLATLALTLVQLFKSNRAQKRQVSFEFTPASKEEFDKHVAQNQRDHENLFSKLGGVERGAAAKLGEEIRLLREERRVDTGELHEKVNSVAVDVGGLKTGMDLINQNLALLIAERRRDK